MNLAFLNIGTQEMVLIVIVALFLFGGKKLPELARGLGRGIREFKDASEGIKREISDQINNFEKDLDLEEDVKSAQPNEPTKTAVVAQQINTHSEENKKEDGQKSGNETQSESKLPTFGPPPGTYQHNPTGSEPKTEEEEQYYQYGYTDHFGEQNNVEYTPGPEEDSLTTEEPDSDTSANKS